MGWSAALRALRSVTGVPSSVYVIEYDGRFIFPVPTPELWAAMADFDCFSLWWSWLREFSVEGNGLQHGTVLHGVVAPRCPTARGSMSYSTSACPNGASRRSCVGISRARRSSPFDGGNAETRAHAVWTIEMMQRPMRVAARLAKPLLRWGHDRVVDATVDGFRGHLVGEDAG